MSPKSDTKSSRETKAIVEYRNYNIKGFLDRTATLNQILKTSANAFCTKEKETDTSKHITARSPHSSTSYTPFPLTSLASIFISVSAALRLALSSIALNPLFDLPLSALASLTSGTLLPSKCHS